MDFKDRIEKIKKLLDYCNEKQIEYFGDKEYFIKFFVDHGYSKPFTGKVKITSVYPFISFTYEAKSYGLHAYEDITILFKNENEDLNDYDNRWLRKTIDGILTYSDIDEEVWKRIEKLAEIRANDYIQEQLIDIAREHNMLIKKAEELKKLIEN